MSYDIYLVDPVTRETLLADNNHHMTGGTYRVGGTRELHLNVTYNYSNYLQKFIDEEKGIRYIYGMSGIESIPVLKGAIRKLSDDTSDDYWESTEGNVKRALIKLLTIAEMRPDGVWDGD